MPTTMHRQPVARSRTRPVRPSILDPATSEPFTLEQQLEPFGHWVGEPIWVPPKDQNAALAETMIRQTRPFASQETRWDAVEAKHRQEFTQVREIDLLAPSIRLPKGRFLVSVTEQKDFDTIEDTVPACVQTRLEEFLAGPGQRRGVKVYYLKPLCVESGDELILTTREDLNRAIEKIQAEVFAEYRRQAVFQRTTHAIASVGNAALALPRLVVNHYVQRRQKQIDALQARLEFKRRKTAMGAARTYQKCRTTPCTFDDMLELTNPLDRREVIDQYCIEQELSRAKRQQLLEMAAGAVPWFVALSLTVSYLTSLGLYLSTPVLVCDPAFVAEMPDAPGVLLKIGHFDEVGGVMHVEI
ncbi:hypothetical protein [Aeoliella sp.]|uniref:hypothetical protein n=1 Tax=Aeoliella sp. TaxID=2795800 RepID=UPI003CCB9213